MKNIKELEQPETFENEVFESIPPEVQKYAEMHHIESKFINGLLRQTKPLRILELGVAEGGSTCVLLNAIKDRPEATLTSVDIAQTCYQYPERPVAFCVDMLYPEGDRQWTLYTGVDFSEICADFEEQSFDFCVIDTAHRHPVESLNFLCALPYLAPDAIVVFHDLSLFVSQELSIFPNICLANKLCFDTIVGHKLKPSDRQYLIDNKGFCNLGAVQISADTFKYVQNVFDMLYFPWSVFGTNLDMKPILAAVRRFYPPEQYSDLSRAYLLNFSYSVHGYFSQYIPDTELLLHFRCQDGRQTIFYGAGAACKYLLGYFKKKELTPPAEIWDRNENITAVDGIPVSLPPFIGGGKLDEGEMLIIITINDGRVVSEVKAEISVHYPRAKVVGTGEFFLAYVFDEIESILRAEV